MVTNALRAYLQLATGLTEVTKQKATDAAKQLSAQLGVQGDEAMATAGAVASIASQQIQTLTDDLLAAAKSNRKLLSDLVQFEVDRGASQLAKLDPQQLDGLLSAVRRLADEIASLTGVSRSKTSAPSADGARQPDQGHRRPPARHQEDGEEGHEEGCVQDDRCEGGNREADGGEEGSQEGSAEEGGGEEDNREEDTSQEDAGNQGSARDGRS